MLPAPFAERCDAGMVVLLLLFAAPLYTHTLTSGSLVRFCLSGQMTQTRLESTAVISSLLPVTFYSFPSSRPSGLEEIDTARRWGGWGEGVKMFAL